MNNPVRYQDPTGESAIGATAEWILTGIGWVLAVIEPTPAGEIAITMISAGKTTIFVVDTVQEGIEKFKKMAEANTKNEKIGKGMAEAHKKGETEGGSNGTLEPEKNSNKNNEQKNGSELSSKNGIKIKGFTKHGLNISIDRTVKPGAIVDAVKNPLKIEDVVIDQFGRPSQRFVGRYGEVVLNPKTGEIISVNPTSASKVNKLLNQTKK